MKLAFAVPMFDEFVRRIIPGDIGALLACRHSADRKGRGIRGPIVFSPPANNSASNATPPTDRSSVTIASTSSRRRAHG